ncbi:hypothetical protein [Candidatus Methylacidithermus pantelleriae]|uniref:Uncharacterized protein n=1 Tax=Candidatus Methylacidithermus pantelleriae TaxID=2744239 RepID=A0A8J2FUH8_9BACT|nr:hypothetical protein [Candidatus Methylacidithermus pantelleriae]CAF0703896.1 hypothetical protein MPNT_60131 [Candidatus Methylacidithermus pantelleriae]
MGKLAILPYQTALRVTVEQGALRNTYAALCGRARRRCFSVTCRLLFRSTGAIDPLPAAVWLDRPRVPCPPGPSSKQR